MGTAEQDTWQGGWTAEDPVEIGHTHVPHDAGAWRDSDEPGFESRDLGLDQASEGAMGVVHLRRSGQDVDPGWRSHGTDFHFTYLLAGSAVVETPDGERHALGADDTVRHSRGAWYRLSDVSEDFEAIRITAPAEFPTERTGSAPAGADASATGFTYEGPEAYEMAAGPRKFFKYRDLQTREPTEERVHIHVVRATGEPGAGTNWHYHSMAQWFLILDGTSHIRVEDGPDIELVKMDTMCIGAGPRMRHNVAPFSGDYAVLEMCVPAEYETIATDPPEGAAPAPEGAVA